MTGRPRDPDIDGAVISAALDLLTYLELGALPIDAVAARAGVAKTTVYRRWPSGDALLSDAVAALDDTVPGPLGTSLGEDLTRLAESLRPVARLLPSLQMLARRNENTAARLAAILEKRQRLLDNTLARAAAREELHSTPDGAILFRLLIAAAAQDDLEPAVLLLVHGLTRTQETFVRRS
ncbi:TetR family transcriptional regulator [Sphaerisporangium sp. B11E5]|uniref:TetR/AcrR family transcriptional regulator n=1 Tax=Sphaerisporangium sp. B11E5 TaxID=3153563 RepID=UPI00325C68F3